MLNIGDKAPSFTAETTKGTINFPDDFKDKWVVFFSHPGDFTPVCTTEIMSFASVEPEFNNINAWLLGLSVDANPSHIAWLRAIQNYQWKNKKNIQVRFPIIADATAKIAGLYGMIAPNESSVKTVRSVYIIDGKSKIRAILTYPMTNGRNISEILRLVKALQLTDKSGIATPADWMPGEDVILPAPQTFAESDNHLNSDSQKTIYCLDWYLCFTPET